MILAFGAQEILQAVSFPPLLREARASVPSSASLSRRGHGATEVAIGDLRDRAALDAALKDVGAVFYIAPAFIPAEANVGKTVVKAAIDAGVRRLVFSAVIHPALSDLVNHVAKAPVEEAVLNSGLEYTFLHPARYFQNYAAFWPKIVKEGVLAEPWSSETRFSLVDYRDVAEVAAIALTEDRLLFGTFELCARGQLDRHDVGALMSDVLGRKIGERRDPGVLGVVSQDLKAMFDHYDHHGLLGNPLTLRAILGREPRSLRAYLKELARGDPAGFGKQG
ncbi:MULTISPECIES: NmrA family NAD(P)-binding protein [unclassified Mesorhizobium]|uniref:NmrA family NAD(P)-binding protein n=1 Tax=unclassified Mesorhizobium TaxID=325217 RepID=UPI001FE1DF59|nr:MULTISPECIES: NmrA family NAD(P)-binding protein [unclassified Mesorhizobium]